MARDDVRLAPAFDDCLHRLDAGASLNDCLLDYPQLADDLRPMLQTVRLLRNRPRSRPTVTQIERMQAAYLRRVQPSKRSTSLPKGYAVMGAVAAMLVVFAVLFALNRPPESAGVPSPTMTATFISTPTAIPTPTRTDTSTATTTATTTVTLTFTPSLAPSPGETQAAVAPTVESAVTSASVTVPLWAGQTINAGRVVISNDAANLYVTYQTSPEWLLQQTHIDLRNEAPVNSENLAPGQFAYKTDPHAPQVSEFTYTIPLDALNGEIIILSHASLIGVGSRQGEEETAWGGDISGAARRWYFYTIYTLQH